MTRSTIDAAFSVGFSGATARQIGEARVNPQLLRGSHVLDNIQSRTVNVLTMHGRLNGHMLKANADDLIEAKHHLAVLDIARQSLSSMIADTERQMPNPNPEGSESPKSQPSKRRA